MDIIHHFWRSVFSFPWKSMEDTQVLRRSCGVVYGVNLDWLTLLNIIKTSWRHRAHVWRNTECPCDAPVPIYSAHSKYLPAQKPHCWQGQGNVEPSNLLDFSLVHSMTIITEMFLSSSYISRKTFCCTVCMATHVKSFCLGPSASIWSYIG